MQDVRKIWLGIPQEGLGLPVAPEPGALPLGVLPGAQFDLLCGCCGIPAPQEGRGHLLIADGLHGGAGCGDAAVQQGLDLPRQPVRHHTVHPAINAVP